MKIQPYPETSITVENIANCERQLQESKLKEIEAKLAGEYNSFRSTRLN